MNINDLSKKLNVSNDTIDRWITKLSIEVQKDSRGRKVYTDEIFQLLQSVKQLRDEDNGLDTITRKLGLDSAEVMHNLGISNTKPDAEQVQQYGTSDLALVIRDSQQFVVSALKTELESITELSKAYGAMSHRVGQLEAELKAEKDKTKLISEANNKDIFGVQKEMEKLKVDKDRELEKQKLEIENLKAELQKEKTKPWYKKLFKYNNNFNNDNKNYQ